MDELFIAAAKLMPEDDLLQELEKALDTYKVLRTDKSKGKLTMYCALLTVRYSSESEDLSTSLKKITEARDISNLSKNKKQ